MASKSPTGPTMEGSYQYEELKSPSTIRLLKIERNTTSIIRGAQDATTSGDKPSILRHILRGFRNFFKDCLFKNNKKVEREFGTENISEPSRTSLDDDTFSDYVSEHGLTFDLITTNLSDAPPYETVSYVWGSGPQDAHLTIGTRGFLNITQLLWASLPQLTNASETSYLWIDQICIDQKSKLEKNHQVRIMGEIYRRCFRVLIYLAPELYPRHVQIPIRSYDEHRFVRSGGKADFRHIVRTFLGLQYYSQHSGHRKSKPPPSDPDYAQSLLAWKKVWVSTTNAFAMAQLFFGHPWFFRGWVIQEMVLSPSAVFVTCDYVFKAEDHAEVCIKERESKPQDWRDTVQPFSGYSRFSKMIEWGSPATDDPLWILDTFASTSKFSLAQDQIFGLLGVMSHVNLDPDYSLAWHEVFTLTAAEIIKVDGTLRILGHLHRDRTQLPNTIFRDDSHRLPSWVPCWYLPKPPETAQTDGFESNLTVCANRTHAPTITTNKQFLRVRGGRIGRVSRIDFSKSRGLWRDFINFTLDQPDYIAMMVNLIPLLKGKYPSFGPTFQRFVDRISLEFDDGPSPSTRTSPPIFRDSEKDGDLRGFVSVLRWIRENLNRVSPMSEQILSNTIRQFMQCCGHSVSFVLEDGRMGRSWGRPDVECGDIVCILHGLFMPVILRPLPNHESRSPQIVYQVISLCNIKGCANGEAVSWEEDDAEEFLLC